MKKVYILGIGVGSLYYMHKRSIEIIETSQCLIGAKRMLQSFTKTDKEKFESIDPKAIEDFINKSNYKLFSVLVSGDVGFYSISKKLSERLVRNGEIEVESIPAISSLQYLCSKLNIPWDNIKHISAHGRNANIISNIMFNKKVFILTGGGNRPDNICSFLVDKGLAHLKVTVGENLSYEDERIIEDNAYNISKMKFGSLASMIVHNDEALECSIGLRSIKDDEFIKGRIPMTKSEVRAVSISKLNLRSYFTVYDIGAGTGSVSIEAALKLTNGTLYAIEKNDEAIQLIKENCKKFKAYNIEIVKGIAPEALIELPKPDAVFIGGSSGRLDDILNLLINKNPRVNIVINAIALESLNEAIKCMEKYNIDDIEIVNISISKAKKTGSYNMMMGQNPIYIISGKGGGSN